MNNNMQYSSINIALLQARESVMAFFRPIFNSHDITEQQWRIFRLLAENGTLDFQDLADKACILRPSLTGILSRLEKTGYVVKLKPTNDQRRVFLKLTEQGETLHKKLKPLIDEQYAQIDLLMTPERTEQLKTLLDNIRQIAPNQASK